jgi:hypothetical protein
VEKIEIFFIKIAIWFFYASEGLPSSWWKPFSNPVRKSSFSGQEILNFFFLSGSPTMLMT